MKSLPILTALAGLFLLTGMGSCSPTLQQACQTQYPKFEESVADALTVLVAWNQPLENRELASVSDVPQAEPKPVIALQDRVSWEEWAEEHLKEVEQYIDLAKAAHATEVKNELSQIANELVTFHGQASKGHLARMVSHLKSINEHSAQVHALACTAH